MAVTGLVLASQLGGEEREGARRRRRSGGLALYAQELADVKSLARTLEKDFDASKAEAQGPVSGQYTGDSNEDDKGDEAVVSNSRIWRIRFYHGRRYRWIDGAYTLSGRWRATAARGSSSTATASRSPSLVRWSRVASLISSSARRAKALWVCGTPAADGRDPPLVLVGLFPAGRRGPWIFVADWSSTALCIIGLCRQGRRHHHLLQQVADRVIMQAIIDDTSPGPCSSGRRPRRSPNRRAP